MCVNCGGKTNDKLVVFKYILIQHVILKTFTSVTVINFIRLTNVKQKHGQTIIIRTENSARDKDRILNVKMW